MVDSRRSQRGTANLLMKQPADAHERRREGCRIAPRVFYEKGFAGACKRLEQSGGLWVAWPKKASGVKTDLTEGVAREVGLPEGLVDNKVCAIDETWSGLQFVWRLENRPR